MKFSVERLTDSLWEWSLLAALSTQTIAAHCSFLAVFSAIKHIKTQICTDDIFHYLFIYLLSVHVLWCSTFKRDIWETSFLNEELLMHGAHCLDVFVDVWMLVRWISQSVWNILHLLGISFICPKYFHLHAMCLLKMSFSTWVEALTVR